MRVIMNTAPPIRNHTVSFADMFQSATNAKQTSSNNASVGLSKKNFTVSQSAKFDWKGASSSQPATLTVDSFKHHFNGWKSHS